MEWTPEAIRAEMHRRHAAARHEALVRRLRESRGQRPTWWRRLRVHPPADGDAADGDQWAA